MAELAGATKLKFLIQFLLDDSGAKEGRKTIEAFAQQTQTQMNRLGSGFQETDRNMKLMSKTTKDGTQNFLQLSQSFKDTNGQMYQSIRYFNMTKNGLRENTKMAQLNAMQNEEMSKSLGSVIAGMGKLALRAAVVVPIWMAIRFVMRAVIDTISGVIKEFQALDTGMRKVMAVATYSADTQARVYADLEKKARDYFATSSRGFKEITEAMYQLGTAGRSTEEIMMGFEHIMNLTIGTFGNVQDAGRVVSGILNVFEDQLKSVGTTTQQVQYVTDLLADAWKNNQIELNEITTAMSYLGGIGTTLNISLEELLGSAAVMSDAMLRGGKGARYLARSLVQISKDSDKLRDLGVVFDPFAPLDYVDIMKQLHVIYEQQGDSMNFLNSVMEAFGMRGGQAVLNILNMWEKWLEEIDKTPSKIRGTAAELKALAEQDYESIIKTYKHLFSTGRDVGTGKSAKKEVLIQKITDEKAIREEIENIRTLFNVLGEDISQVVSEEDMSNMLNYLKFAEGIPNIVDEIRTKGGVGENVVKQSDLEGMKAGLLGAWNALVKFDKELEKNKLMQFLEIPADFTRRFFTIFGLINELRGKRILSPEDAEIGKRVKKNLSDSVQVLKELGLTDVLKTPAQTQEEKDMDKYESDLKTVNDLMIEISKEQKEATKDQKQKITGMAIELGIHEALIPKFKEGVLLKAEELRKQKEINKAQGDFSVSQLKALSEIKQSAHISEMQVQGYKESEIAYAKLINLASNFNDVNENAIAMSRRQIEVEKKLGEEDASYREKAQKNIDGLIKKIQEYQKKKIDIVSLEDATAESLKEQGAGMDLILEILKAIKALDLARLKENQAFTSAQKEQLLMQHNINMLQESGLYTDREIILAKMAQVEASKDLYTQGEKEAELLKLKLEYIQSMNREIGKYSDVLKDAFSTNLADMIKGDIAPEEFFPKIAEAAREAQISAFSEGLADTLFGATGIGAFFGEQTAAFRHAFEGPIGKIKGAYDYGAKKTKEAIISGFTVGTGMLGKEAAYGMGMGIGAGMGTPIGYGGGGFIGGGLPGMTSIPGMGWLNQPMWGGGGAVGATNRNLAAMFPQNASRMAGAPGMGHGPSWGQMLGFGMSTATAFAGGYDQGGMIPGLLSGGGSALMGLASMGAMTTAAGAPLLGAGMAAAAPFLGPIGLALGIGGMLWGMFSEPPDPPEWSREETKEQTMQIASRIDITNKSLEWVNRNLVELRQELTYIMRESFYFSEKSEAERFAIDSQRGVTGG